jgi:hypothetical protein
VTSVSSSRSCLAKDQDEALLFPWSLGTTEGENRDSEFYLVIYPGLSVVVVFTIEIGNLSWCPGAVSLAGVARGTTNTSESMCGDVSPSMHLGDSILMNRSQYFHILRQKDKIQCFLLEMLPESRSD